MYRCFGFAARDHGILAAQRSEERKLPRPAEAGINKMNTDVVIVGAGPAGIFTALEMLKRV